MFFSRDNLSLELIGVFSIKRTKSKKHSVTRQYDSLSIRISGESEFKFHGKHTQKIGSNELLYLPQNAVYEQKTEGEEIIAVHFINYSYTKRLKPELIEIDDVKHVRELILKMYNLWNEKESGYRYECTSLLYHLLFMLRKQVTNTDTDSTLHDKLLSKAVNYIHTHYKSEHIYVSELAKMVSLSEVYFRKIFKKIYSVSPNKYINNLRLEYAAQLLESKLYTVSEVSENSGFSDMKYFSKCFKDKYGFSPKHYKSIDREKSMN